MNLIYLGGRRFLLSIGCGIACTILLWFGKMSDGIFASIIIATVGAYITGNTAQKVSAINANKGGADDTRVD